MVELSIIHTNSPVLKTVLHLSNVFLESKIKKISPIVSQIFHYRVFAVCACKSIDVAIPWHVWYGNATFLSYENLLNAMIQNSLSWCHTHGTPFLCVNIQTSILFSMNRRLWCIYLPCVYDITNFIYYIFLLKRNITLSLTAFCSFNVTSWTSVKFWRELSNFIL